MLYIIRGNDSAAKTTIGAALYDYWVDNNVNTLFLNRVNTQEHRAYIPQQEFRVYDGYAYTRIEFKGDLSAIEPLYDCIIVAFDEELPDNKIIFHSNPVYIDVTGKLNES